MRVQDAGDVRQLDRHGCAIGNAALPGDQLGGAVIDGRCAPGPSGATPQCAVLARPAGVTAAIPGHRL
jgi:hypothetical protein